MNDPANPDQQDNELTIYELRQIRAQSVLSPGMIVLHAGDTFRIEGKFAKCNGQEVLRDVFPALYEVIGTTFGEGDGVTTFNLPKLEPLAPGIHYVICLFPDSKPRG